MSAVLDMDHLSQWIGREEVVEDVLTPSLVDRFNATLGCKSEGDVAPLLIHLCLAPSAVPEAKLGPDGHPLRGGFLPPVPLQRRMWAGGSFKFHAPLRVGPSVLRRSRITGVTSKTGRSGPLCFVAVEHEIRQDDALAVVERQDIVYRDPAPGQAGAARGEPAPRGTETRLITPTSTLLFRFSALTFNGHRIHYDKPYATRIEGYPGLVVHGPMQATLLCHLAADLHGTAPRRFDFRSVAPIYDTGDFTLNAERHDDSYHLWTAQVGGPVAMEATARW